MAKDFTITSKYLQSRMEWLRMFGATSLPVKSFIPKLALLPEADEPQSVYYVDLDCLTPPQRQRLIRHLSVRFNLPAEQVQQNLAEQDIPILAAECVVMIDNPHKWLE